MWDESARTLFEIIFAIPFVLGGLVVLVIVLTSRQRRGPSGPMKLPRYCTKCGTAIAYAAYFCVECGAPLQAQPRPSG